MPRKEKSKFEFEEKKFSLLLKVACSSQKCPQTPLFFLKFKFWFFFAGQLRMTVLDCCISLKIIKKNWLCWELWICASFCYMNLVAFCLRADWAVLGIIENSIFLQYSTFDAKKYDSIRVFIQCSIRTNDMIIIKLRKLSILASRYDFWGKNRLKHAQSILNARE